MFIDFMKTNFPLLLVWNGKLCPKDGLILLSSLINFFKVCSS
jgi:hypothetical protein